MDKTHKDVQEASPLLHWASLRHSRQMRFCIVHNTIMHGEATVTSVLLSSASLRHLERMSPTAGPPSTLTISAVLPPSSDTGSTWATLVVKFRRLPAIKHLIVIYGALCMFMAAARCIACALSEQWQQLSPATLLKAVPPLNTSKAG